MQIFVKIIRHPYKCHQIHFALTIRKILFRGIRDAHSLMPIEIFLPVKSQENPREASLFSGEKNSTILKTTFILVRKVSENRSCITYRE